MTLKPGDQVVYSRFGIGSVDLSYKDEDYVVIKERDIVGKMPPDTPFDVSTMSEIIPLADRLLVEVIPEEDETEGGVLLPEIAKDRPYKGKVIRKGPGRET